MTQTSYTPPTDAEIRAIHDRARRLRAEAMRDAFRSLRRSVGALFASRPVRTADNLR